MNDQDERMQANRIIDLKLPLSWLLSSAATIVLAIVGMFFKLDQLGTDVAELKATVRAGNVTASTVQSEVTVLRYRIETLEKERSAR